VQDEFTVDRKFRKRTNNVLVAPFQYHGAEHTYDLSSPPDTSPTESTPDLHRWTRTRRNSMIYTWMSCTRKYDRLSLEISYESHI